MNIIAMLALLQAAASLLVSVQQNPQTAPAVMQNAVALAGNTIQSVVQANAKIYFAVKENSGIWPNIDGLLNAPYLDSENNYVRLGSSVLLLQGYTSFGDLNNDGFDDAAAIVNKPAGDGTPRYFLAAMLNREKILFNIADFPLGNSVDIDSHRVIDGKIVIDGSKYELVGKELKKVL